MRTNELEKIARRRRLDLAIVGNEANVRALTGVACDNARVVLADRRGTRQYATTFYTDFRYTSAVRRQAPDLKIGDIRRIPSSTGRIGYESSMSHAAFLALEKANPRATFVDLAEDLRKMRAVKTPEEIARIRAAEALTCSIWQEARSSFRAGMTEREMAAVIRKMMIDRGDGEAFPTIVCVGANAAECHHEPDGTVWNGREPVLVDMGVKLDGYCSDLTRNIVPKRARPIYRQIYELVRAANRAAIAAVRPGITGKALDKVARDMIRKGGFGRCFGHALGHGVGLEIHEAPTASKRDTTILRAGMLVTIEPGVYLEGNLGVRIEDLVLVTEGGCEVLSTAATDFMV